MWKLHHLTPLLFLITIISITTLEVYANPQVPCFFIFGDSLSDAGNNNGLNTKARANYQPYGVDFTGHRPTGRFTNGRTAVDVIAEHLGFEGYISSYNSATGQEILRGVNYASGSAGILSETAQHLGARISLGEQLKSHKTTISKLGGLLNGSSVREHLHSCLYTINIGSNDYINNYFMPDHYNTNTRFNPDQFATTLIAQYSRHVKTLYKNGARKVALFGLGLIGCSFAEVARHRPKTLCVESINNATLLFNQKLKALVDQLNVQLPGSKVTFISNQAILLGPDQGFAVSNATCCEVREDFQCKESSTPCKERNGYVFWDGFHPTEAVNRVVGGRAYKAVHPLDAHPFDISSLVNS